VAANYKSIATKMIARRDKRRPGAAAAARERERDYYFAIRKEKNVIPRSNMIKFTRRARDEKHT
jgi:hypothetical protein